MPGSRRVAFWLMASLFLSMGLNSALATPGSVHAAAECHVNENEPGDDPLAAIAKRVPAFGGFYVDGANLDVWLTDQGESLDAAVQEILSVPGYSDLADLTPVALPAKYSFLQLFCWQYGPMLEVFPIQGIVFTDIDDMKNRLTVAVEDVATQGPAVKARLREVGIPLEAVEIIEEGPIMLYPGPADPSGPQPVPQSSGSFVVGIAVGCAFAAIASVMAFRGRKKRALQDREILGLPS